MRTGEALSENEFEIDPNPCGASWKAMAAGGRAWCGRANGHKGMHHDMEHGELWDQDAVAECDYRMRTPERIVRCDRLRNHEGDHTADRTYNADGELIGGIRFSTQESLAFEAEVEQGERINNLRADLKKALAYAAGALTGAQTAIRNLKSNAVYDIEFAEGETIGGHIEHAVREAALFTAAAQAMVDVVLK